MFIIRSHRCSVTIAPHAICMRANILSLRLIENFLRFQVQDKHNAFSFVPSYVLKKIIHTQL